MAICQSVLSCRRPQLTTPPHPRPGATPGLAVRPLVYILAPAVSVTAASIWCIVTSLRLTSPLPSGWCSSGSCRRYICTCLRRRGRLSTGRRLPREVLGLLCYSWASGSDGMTTPTCWVRLVDWGAQARRGWRASTDPPHLLPPASNICFTLQLTRSLRFVSNIRIYISTRRKSYTSMLKKRILKNITLM